MKCLIAIGTAIEYAKGTLNRFTKEWQRIMFGPSKDSQAVDDYIDNLKTKHSKEKYLAVEWDPHALVQRWLML